MFQPQSQTNEQKTQTDSKSSTTNSQSSSASTTNTSSTWSLFSPSSWFSPSNALNQTQSEQTQALGSLSQSLSSTQIKTGSQPSPSSTSVNVTLSTTEVPSTNSSPRSNAGFDLVSEPGLSLDGSPLIVPANPQTIGKETKESKEINDGKESKESQNQQPQGALKPLKTSPSQEVISLHSSPTHQSEGEGDLVHISRRNSPHSDSPTVISLPTSAAVSANVTPSQSGLFIPVNAGADRSHSPALSNASAPTTPYLGGENYLNIKTGQIDASVDASGSQTSTLKPEPKTESKRSWKEALHAVQQQTEAQPPQQPSQTSQTQPSSQSTKSESPNFLPSPLTLPPSHQAQGLKASTSSFLRNTQTVISAPAETKQPQETHERKQEQDTTLLQLRNDKLKLQQELSQSAQDVQLHKSRADQLQARVEQMQREVQNLRQQLQQNDHQSRQHQQRAESSQQQVQQLNQQVVALQQKVSQPPAPVVVAAAPPAKKPPRNR